MKAAMAAIASPAIGRELGQRFRSSRHLSRPLLPAGGVAPPRQIPNMPASVRLASEQNDLELCDSNFGNAGLVILAKSNLMMPSPMRTRRASDISA